jgi:DNA modification methylase
LKEELEEIKRLNRKPISYKITKEQVKYAIKKLKENELPVKLLNNFTELQKINY